MTVTPPGSPSPDPTPSSPLAADFLRCEVDAPIGKGPEPCLTCDEEECISEDCEAFVAWTHPALLPTDQYRAMWDEEAAFDGMRRTWGSTMEVYTLVAQTGPHRANPLLVMETIYNIHQEVIP